MYWKHYKGTPKGEDGHKVYGFSGGSHFMEKHAEKYPRVSEHKDLIMDLTEDVSEELEKYIISKMDKVDEKIKQQNEI
mgnify:CR=1 FL=1